MATVGTVALERTNAVLVHRPGVKPRALVPGLGFRDEDTSPFSSRVLRGPLRGFGGLFRVPYQGERFANHGSTLHLPFI